MRKNLEPNDARLSRLLQTWRVDESLPPRFQENVWKRIEAIESNRVRSTGPGSVQWLAILFTRPAFAAVCAGVLLLAGLTTGFVRANHDSARLDRELAQRYVEAVNPYANLAH